MQCKLSVLISCIKLIHKRLKIYCLRSFRLNRQVWWGGWNRLHKGRALRLQYGCTMTITKARVNWLQTPLSIPPRGLRSMELRTGDFSCWSRMYTTSVDDWKLMHRLNRALVSSNLRLHACQSCQNLDTVRAIWVPRIGQIIYMTLVDKCATLW